MSLKLPVLKRLGANPTPVAIAQEVERLRTWFEGVRIAGGFHSDIDILGAIGEAIDGIEFPPEYVPPVYDTPTVPTDLVATGLFGKIMLQWAWVDYNGHSRTEIWRAQVDDLGLAVKVGDAWTPDVLFVDSSLPNSSLGATYYYWVRLVNKNDLAGAFNGVAGTPGSTADDPDYLIELATESKWKPNFNYALGDLTMPRVPNGYVYEVTVDGGSSSGAEPEWPVIIDDTVVDGGLTWKCKSELSIESFFAIALVGGVAKLTLREIFIADQVVSRAKIKDLAVNDAKIENLSVAKLIAGIIEASNIFLGAEAKIHLDGGNNRILVTDAADTVRVILGKLGAGAYGIEIYDTEGVLILGSGGVPLSKVTGAGGLAWLDTLGYSALTGTKPPADADKTSANIAAGIAGQGIFATAPQLTGANISTYIQSAAIQTLMANIAWINEANINDATVTTLKIGANAVTVPVGAYTAALGDNQSLPSTDFGGGKVVITFSFVGYLNVTHPDGGGASFPVVIYRGGVAIYSAMALNLQLWSTGTLRGSGTGMIVDTPGSGYHTYSMTVAGAEHRCLVAMGVKR